MSIEIDGFSHQWEISHGELSIPVYASDEGQIPLIVLHELPGMTPSFLCYCRRMAREGFKVYAPLIFGEPESTMSTCQTVRFCISGTFRKLFKKKGEVDCGFAKWILLLIEHVSKKHSDQEIGVIGMCLTGGFALVGFAAPSVSAVICCQPAYPFLLNVESLGMSKGLRTQISDGANKLEAPACQGYRFEKDWICRNRHMAAISNLLNDKFERTEDLPGGHHSTVTGGNPSQDAFDSILEFLRRRLPDSSTTEREPNRS